MTIIERYFKESLKKTELKDFLDELKTNSELKDEFEKIEKLRNFIDLKDGTFFDDIKSMTDFDFDPEIYLDIIKYKRPPKQGEKDITLP